MRSLECSVWSRLGPAVLLADKEEDEQDGHSLDKWVWDLAHA